MTELETYRSRINQFLILIHLNEYGDLRISCVPIGNKPDYCWAESDFRASFTWVSDR